MVRLQNQMQIQNQIKIKDGAPTKNLDASRPAPKPIKTVHEAMAFLNRAVIGKSGNAPSEVNRQVKRNWGLLKALEHDFPGQLGEVVLRVDLLPREPRSAAWYGQQVRVAIQSVRHEQVKQAAPRAELLALTAGIGR